MFLDADYEKLEKKYLLILVVSKWSEMKVTVMKTASPDSPVVKTEYFVVERHKSRRFPSVITGLSTQITALCPNRLH